MMPSFAIQKALEAVAGMTAARHPAIGRGHDLRLEGDGLVGGALIAEGPPPATVISPRFLGPGAFYFPVTSPNLST